MEQTMEQTVQEALEACGIASPEAVATLVPVMARARRMGAAQALEAFAAEEQRVIEEAIQRYAPDRGARAVEFVLRRAKIKAVQIVQGAVDGF